MGRGSTDQNNTVELLQRSTAEPAGVSDTQWLLDMGISQPMQVLVVVLRKLQDSRHRAVPVEALKTTLSEIDWVALGRQQGIVPSHLVSNARKPSYGLVEFDGRGAVKLTRAGRDYAARIDQDAALGHR